MIELRINGENWSKPAPKSQPDLVTKSRYPKFAIPRISRREEILSSIGALLRGPSAPRKFVGALYFRDCCIDQRSPRAAFLIAIACQALLVLFPPPIWNIHPARVEAFSPTMELTWYGPPQDFPALLPELRPPEKAPPQEVLEPPSRQGADAFHPRQTIVSEPPHPTHPRQTLIQPTAPPEPPKILPELPNIVRLVESQPARPKLQLTSEQLAALRPVATELRPAQDSALPELSTPEKQLGEINIASSASAPPKPALPVSPMSTPRAAPQRGDNNAGAPEFTQQQPGGDATTLIALSATPAPVAPPSSVPPGNLSTRISVSPEGPHPGAPAGTAQGNPSNSNSTAGAGGKGPEGIFVSTGNNASPNSGSGTGSTLRGSGNTLPSRPVPRVSIPARDSNAPRLNSGSAQDAPKLDVPPEKILGSKRVYTLHVNMPNLTSVSGSWVLNFAELEETGAGSAWSPAEKDAGSPPAGRAGTWSPPETGAGSTWSPPKKSAGAHAQSTTADVAGPVALRKVDPKYPPELRTAHVEGEVILYAIIRKDGTVDSIQLVHGVDSHLDSNAMEALAQWKFQPAEKSGEPIDLEAVVHIPFRSRLPAF
jgi:TonB family protein